MDFIRRILNLLWSGVGEINKEIITYENKEFGF